MNTTITCTRVLTYVTCRWKSTVSYSTSSIGECNNKSIKHIFLEVRTSNVPAISLYKKFDFNEIGVRPNYYLTKKGYEDAIIMGRDLS